MFFIVETQKSFDQVASSIESIAKQNGFGVLHVHDLHGILNNKGFPFSESCKVFEICNPSQASKVMGIDMKLNMALPCRLSVYTENGKVKIGMIKPTAILNGLSSDPTLAKIAQEVEDVMIKIIEGAS